MAIRKALDTSKFENEADKKVLADIEALRAAGGDPFGDDGEEAILAAESAAIEHVENDASDADDESGDAAAAEDAANDAADATEEPTQSLEAGQQVAPADVAPQVADEPQPKQSQQALYETRPQEEISEARKTLRAEKSKAFKDFDQGTISPDEYQAIVDRVDDSLEQLIVQSTLAVANEQSELRMQAAVIDSLVVKAKGDGTIDYKEAGSTAPSEFNTALRLLASQPANTSLAYHDLVDKAHQMVLALRGVKPVAPAKPAAQAAQARKNPAAPLTLSGVPAASTPNTNGGVTEQLSRLDGLDFQEAVGRMPKAQRNAWLDS